MPGWTPSTPCMRSTSAITPREQGDGRAQVDSRADFGNSRSRKTSDREQDGERVASEGQRGVASHRTFVL